MLAFMRFSCADSSLRSEEMQMAYQERLISADSHVNPPKDLWTRCAPAKLRDRAPRVESTPQGDFWIVDSQLSGAIGLDASAGRKP